MAAEAAVQPATNVAASIADVVPRKPVPTITAAPVVTAPPAVATPPIVTAARSELPAAAPSAQTPVQLAPQKLDHAAVAAPGTTPVRRFNGPKLAVIAALPPQPLPQQGDSRISLDLKAAALSALRPRVTGPRRKAAPRRETTLVSPRDVFMSTYGTSR
jgi:hypothetical protein